MNPLQVATLDGEELGTVSKVTGFWLWLDCTKPHAILDC